MGLGVPVKGWVIYKAAHLHLQLSPITFSLALFPLPTNQKDSFLWNPHFANFFSSSDFIWKLDSLFSEKAGPVTTGHGHTCHHCFFCGGISGNWFLRDALSGIQPQWAVQESAGLSESQKSWVLFLNTTLYIKLQDFGQSYQWTQISLFKVFKMGIIILCLPSSKCFKYDQLSLIIRHSLWINIVWTIHNFPTIFRWLIEICSTTSGGEVGC